MIKVITDSTSYIPKELKQEYGIQEISLSVSFGEESYFENQISNDFFYKKLDEKNEIPKSSQPSVESFCSLFEPAIQNGDSLIGVFISAKMSGTYSTAILVKKMMLEKYPQARIEIIDSESNSMQLGFAALAAARAAKAGMPFEQVVQEVRHNIQSSRFLFIPDTFKYLKMGGRIGSAAALLGSVLQIKPILTVNNGTTDIIDKVRTRSRAIEKMIDVFSKDIEKFGFSEAIIHHINCEKDALELADIIKEKTGKDIKIADIGPVIGTHVGPGAIGIVYCTKEKLIK